MEEIKILILGIGVTSSFLNLVISLKERNKDAYLGWGTATSLWLVEILNTL